MNDTDEVLTIEQTAALLGVSVSHLYYLRSLGRGPRCHKRHTRLAYYRRDVEMYEAVQRERTTRGGVPA